MTKEEFVFTIDYGIKTMEFACADDNCYKAKFVTENDETFDFTCSRQKVMEHVERYSAHPEKYLTNKGLVVAHFHRMAIAWFKKTHLPKEYAKMLSES